MKLLMNSNAFEYDVRGLLMAFYPWIKFVTEEGAEDPDCLRVDYADDTCRLTFTTDGKTYEKEVELGADNAKTKVKQALYEILSEANGRALPWGTLTGIRPTKIARGMLDEERTEEEIRAHMIGDLRCSEAKTELSIGIARREKALLSGIDTEHGFSLYVGIPFCPTTCLYCSFTSYPIARFKNKVWDYLHALEKEIRWTAEKFRGKTLDSIYFGGGTPTTLEPDQLDFLLGLIAENFDLSHLREWTVEAGRPDSVTEEKFAVLRKYPVDRISVNPQTMHQRTLDLIGRRHTVEDFEKAFSMARKAGFTNINTDLILGLPGETSSDVEETIRRIRELDPENVTIHSLAIKRAARLNQEKDMYLGYRMENSDELMEYCRTELKKNGLEPYYLYRQKNMAGNQENTGYAKAGKAGVYNILIMEEVESIVACGAGTVTKKVSPGGLIERCDNVKDVNLYIEKIDEMIERKEELFFRR